MDLVVALSEEWTDAPIAGSAIILVGSDQTGSMPKRAISARSSSGDGCSSRFCLVCHAPRRVMDESTSFSPSGVGYCCPGTPVHRAGQPGRLPSSEAARVPDEAQGFGTDSGRSVVARLPALTITESVCGGTSENER